MRLAIYIPRTRLLSAFAFGAAFLIIVTATVLARGVGSVAGSGSSRTLREVAQDPGLRFGTSQTPLPLVYAPAAVTPPAVAPGSSYAFIWPDDYPLVQGMWAGHPLGIDIGVPPGEPVHAVRDGRVVFAGGDPCCNYGLFIIVEHDDGWSSLYAHFSRLDATYGNQVRQGQELGISGNTGHVTGPHVHFELRHNGGVVDPLDYLEPYRDWTVTADLLAELQHQPATPQTKPDGPAAVAANEPAPVAASEDTAPNAINSLSAISLGSQWLSSQGESAYSIDASSCVAALSGPNWWVTCDGRLQGCASGPACMAQLTACVFDQPRIVTAACP